VRSTLSPQNAGKDRSSRSQQGGEERRKREKKKGRLKGKRRGGRKKKGDGIRGKRGEERGCESQPGKKLRNGRFLQGKEAKKIGLQTAPKSLKGDSRKEVERGREQDQGSQEIPNKKSSGG